MEDKILKVRDLGIKFSGNDILKNVNFDLDQGSMTAVIGPNGAGKTVLFKTLLGIDPYKKIHSGTVEWKRGIKIGYVPQKFNVDVDVPITVRDFFKLKTDKEELIYSAIKTLVDHDEHHIKHHLLDKRFGVLSGGQQQKMLIAWAILNDPDVLLFDEPTTGVDVGGEADVYRLLKKLNEEKKITIMFISHDLNVIGGYADNVLCVNKEMVCWGAPDTVNKETLEKLYGTNTSLYTHEHKHEDGNH